MFQARQLLPLSRSASRRPRIISPLRRSFITRRTCGS